MTTPANDHHATQTDASDLVASLVITKVTDRLAARANGVWATGTIAGHEFQALVFAEPAQNREWEVGGDSRISKLWLRRIADKTVVYEWDRGPAIAPQTPMAGQIVEALAAGLAETVFGN